MSGAGDSRAGGTAHRPIHLDVTDLTLKKSFAAAAAGFALLAVGSGGRDQPALDASERAPTSVFESAPSTVAAAVPSAPAAVNTSPVAAQKTLDEVLDEVDQALADIDSALADTEGNR